MEEDYLQYVSVLDSAGPQPAEGRVIHEEIGQGYGVITVNRIIEQKSHSKRAPLVITKPIR